MITLTIQVQHTPPTPRTPQDVHQWGNWEYLNVVTFKLWILQTIMHISKGMYQLECQECGWGFTNVLITWRRREPVHITISVMWLVICVSVTCATLWCIACIAITRHMCSSLSEPEDLGLLQDFFFVFKIKNKNKSIKPEHSSQDMRRGAQYDDTLLVLFLSNDWWCTWVNKWRI